MLLLLAAVAYPTIGIALTILYLTVTLVSVSIVDRTDVVSVSTDVVTTGDSMTSNVVEYSSEAKLLYQLFS